jgi:hypothetical protein
MNGGTAPHVLDGGEWLASWPGLFTPGKTAPIGGWMDPRVGLDIAVARLKKSLPPPGIVLRSSSP